LDDPVFSAKFAAGMAAVHKGGAPTVLVHGGGKELTMLLEKLSIESKFLDGLRVTSAPARDAAMMVFGGLTNKRLVAAIVNAGANALGLCGVDGALVRVKPIKPELGYVGKPVGVNTALLRALLGAGAFPVLNPICLGEDGEIYNVNADHVAGAIATALDADMLTFVTNVPGVMDKNKVVQQRLSRADADRLIADGTIFGGMIPKVKTALEALQGGVKQVRICDLAGLQAGGTVFAA
jgi:acetylglutamate kinase